MAVATSFKVFFAMSSLDIAPLVDQNDEFRNGRAILRVPAYPEHLNDMGRVRAGYVLKLVDICGVLPALGYLGQGSRVVTACLDETTFAQPIRQWEIITLESRISRVWSTSLETQVRISAWNFHTHQTRFVSEAYLVYVALDERRKKRSIDQAALPQDAESADLAEAADRRKALRQQEQTALPPIFIQPDDQPMVVERVMTNNDANMQNKVFGGVILEMVHQAGFQAAKRQSLGGVVTAIRQDRMSFVAPAFIGETVVAKAIVTKTWLTSMEVQVEVEAHNPVTKTQRPIGHSYLVFVGLDFNEQPVELPPWLPQTDTQSDRAIAADIRRARRLG
jgi:acyl-CoA hydrolase